MHMKAVRFYRHGAPDVLVLENDIPIPSPQAGEVLLKVEAAGVNFADIVRRRGDYYPVPTPLPHICGAEVVGTVEAVGPGVDRSLIGRRFFGAPDGGGYAEYVTVAESLSFPVPDGIDPVQGVPLFIQGLTAALTLKAAGRITSGDSVFIEGAAGGVGTLALQLAKCYGAGKVIAGAGTVEKRALAMSLGADAAIDYRQPGWGKELRALLDGRGVDIALEMSGGNILDECLGCLAPLGRMVVFGIASGEVASVAVPCLLGGSTAIAGFYLGAYFHKRQLIVDTLNEMAAFVRSGRLQVIIGREFSLDEATLAHQAIESGGSLGKLIILP